MEEQLFNGFNNGKNALDGVGGKSNPINYHINKSKELQSRHEQIKNEMLKILETVKILENQYDQLEKELYSVEEQYVDNLKNVIE